MYVQCIRTYENDEQQGSCFDTPDLSGRIMVWRRRLSVRLSTKLVNTIQTEPFQLGHSNLVLLLLMTRGRTLLIFKVNDRNYAFGMHTRLMWLFQMAPKMKTLWSWLKKGCLWTLLPSLSWCCICFTNTSCYYRVQTELFKLGPSNLVHLLLMTRGRILMIFKVRDQRSRSP